MYYYRDRAAGCASVKRRSGAKPAALGRRNGRGDGPCSSLLRTMHCALSWPSQTPVHIILLESLTWSREDTVQKAILGRPSHPVTYGHTGAVQPNRLEFWGAAAARYAQSELFLIQPAHKVRIIFAGPAPEGSRCQCCWCCL